MKKGFYHPDMGYWQVEFKDPLSEKKYTSQYPKDTVEVPLKPDEKHELDLTTFKWKKKSKEVLDTEEAALEALGEAENKASAEKAIERPSGLNLAILNMLFTLANQVRVLEGNKPITKTQFKTYVKGLLDE